MKASMEDEAVFQLIKKASAHAKLKNFDEAIKILDGIIIRLCEYELDFCSVSQKIIPYIQKAGHYENLWPYTEQVILPALKKRVELTFKHRPASMQMAYLSVEYSRVYDKLRLAAEREHRLKDAEKYSLISKQQWENYELLIPQAQDEAEQAELESVKSLFGDDYSTWPVSLLQRFGFKT